MTKKTSRVRDAMAKGEAVTAEPFDPSKVAGDTPAAQKRRTPRKPRAKAAAAEPPDTGDRHDSDAEAPNWTEEELADVADDTRPPELVAVEAAIARLCSGYDQNDAGNAQRLIAWFGPNLCYVSGMGWLTWRGTHWQRDEGELEARRLCQLLVEKIKLEPVHIIATPAQQRLLDAAAHAMKVEFDDRTPAQHDLIGRAAALRKELNSRRSKRRNFAVSSGNSGRTTAMLAQAASFKAFDQKKLDANHMLFNVLNGTLVFSRIDDPEQDTEGADVVPRKIGHVDIRPHDREDMLTKIADVEYAPEATCPEFQKFLDRMMPDDKMQTWLKVSLAYSLLIGGNGAQKLFYHYGLGANGKSALLETIGALAGTYRTTVSPETITGDGQQRQGQQANPDIARLFNTRFVVVEELPKNVPLKENLVKAMSGGSPLTARFLQKEFFEFTPIFTAVLSGNTKPAITGSDKGIWRRVSIIHWKVSIGEKDPSRVEFPELMRRFAAERSGILNWLIEGAMLYLGSSLMAFEPEEARAFTEDYRMERDNIEVFASSMIVPHPGHNIQAGKLFERYQQWCAANGLVAAKQRTFGERLGELGYAKKTGRVYEYTDITLRALPAADDDPGWAPPEGFE